MPGLKKPREPCGTVGCPYGTMRSRCCRRTQMQRHSVKTSIHQC